MTTKEVENQLSQWNIMVHGVRDFAPNQLHKLTWEDHTGADVSMFFENEDSIEHLVASIKWQLTQRGIKSSPEADLIINYY